MEETPFQIQKITKEQKEYPKKLRDYSRMPELLYVKGNLPDPDKPTAAIIGARSCSPYGRVQAFRFAKELSAAGIQIISGLAYGIDTEAHKGAMEGGTSTFGILGNGVDVCYPAANSWLYDKIVKEGGGLISEYEPGVKPKPYHFPIRNRIISALSDVVLIIEAKDKSGSLITARYALEQGKTVYALPGSVTEELSIGCHKLIFDGAGIAYSPEILLSEWGILPENAKEREKKAKENEKLGLESEINMVYSCLDLRPKTPDELILETGFSPEKMNQALMELELLGLSSEVFRHHYIRKG